MNSLPVNSILGVLCNIKEKTIVFAWKYNLKYNGRFFFLVVCISLYDE